MMTSRNGRTIAGRTDRTTDLQEGLPPGGPRPMPPEVGGVSDAAMPPGAVSITPGGAPGVAGARPPGPPMPMDRMPMEQRAPQPAPQPFPMPMPPIGGSIGGSGGGAISSMPPGVGGVGGAMPPTLSPAMQGLEGLIAGAGPGNAQPPGRQPQQRASTRELSKLGATKPGRRVY